MLHRGRARSDELSFSDSDRNHVSRGKVSAFIVIVRPLKQPILMTMDEG
jgi:hypothetical protein